MASQNTPQHPSGFSSQAGLATLRTASAAPRPDSLVALIDAYAAARSVRDESYRECAGWAFDEAHAAMITARAAVADALGIPAAQLSPLDDEISRAAAPIGGAR